MKLYRSASLFCLLVLMVGICRGQDDLEDEDEEDIHDEDVVDVEEEDDYLKTETVVKEKPKYRKPIPKGHVYFAEPFDSEEDFKKRWIKSNAKKDDIDEDIAKYDGVWALEEPNDNPINGDLTLVLKSKAKHHAISAHMDKPFRFDGKPFIVQYEVKFLNGMDCGGAYVKLLSKDPKLDLHNFRDKTPYTIMFGPDKCGVDHKLHFIFRHKHQITGEYEEKHAKKHDGKIDGNFSDKKTHLYRLIVKPDNTFEIHVDRVLINSGSLLTDFSPPVNPPKEIEDPDDSKPETWDEREKIADPDATKPDDWDEDEPEMIVDEDAVLPDGWLVDEPSLLPDPDAEKPSDWDDDMDGEWEAPMINNLKCESAKGCGEWKKPTIKNPKYKGKWRPAVIDNPDYQGVWKPKFISNPNYFEEVDPYKLTSISAVGLELWSMTEDIVFDNFLITDDEVVADAYAADTWDVKHEQEMAASSTGAGLFQAVVAITRDRPWLWAVFIVVVVLPVVLIFAYCCVISDKQGVFQSLKGAAEERPWLWAVYVVVLLLPVVLLSICLCPKSGPIKPADISAKKKKTDEPTPDDNAEDDQPVETPDPVAGGDAPGGDAPGDDAPGGDAPEDAKKPSKSSLEAENADDAGDEDDMEEEPQAGAARRSPRKRTTRKD